MKLHAQQEQKLALTPQMRQSLAVLAMALPELEAYLERELQENCVLELQQEDTDTPDAAGEPEGAEYTGIEEDLVVQGMLSDSWDFQPGEHQPLWKQDSLFLEDCGESVVTLRENLLDQLHLATGEGRGRTIGEYLIGNIDDDGYLRCGLNEAALALGVKEKEVREIHDLIRTFEPTGVGARDLRECLLLQLAAQKCPPAGRSRSEPQIHELAGLIVEGYLEDLGEGRIARIAAEIKRNPHDVRQAVAYIRSLDPKPGRNFRGADEPSYIWPDVIVRKINGAYQALVRETSMSKLGINAGYRRLLTDAGGTDADVSAYLKERIHSALWLIRSIEQRRRTLQRIMDAVIIMQGDFLERGPLFLKPLTMREVAAAAGVHESTVSRAIMGKYAETPRGILPLSYLFHSGLATSSGGQVASESVKKTIRDLVRGEDPKHPLSDQRIALLLADRGVVISRRTVAKYREEMQIPASELRRRH